MASSFSACALTALAGIYGLFFGRLTRQSFFEFYATLASAILGALLVIWVQRAFALRYSKLKKASGDGGNNA